MFIIYTVCSFDSMFITYTVCSLERMFITYTVCSLERMFIIYTVCSLERMFIIYTVCSLENKNAKMYNKYYIRVYMIFFCLEKRCEHLHIFLPGKTVYMMHKCEKCVKKV